MPFDALDDLSRLCLGTMMFGDQTDEEEAARILDGFVAAGGNFIDTADTYAGGESERILGKLLSRLPVAEREGLIVATKVGNKVRGVEGSGGLAPDWVAKAAAMSLERLQRDSIDLYYLHREDDSVPLDETLGAIADLIAAGKVKQWGFSNVRAWKIAEMVRLADIIGMPRPVAAQPYYHILNRQVEIDTLPACHHFGFAVVPYSPLARGVLTGKYREGAPPDSRAGRGDKRIRDVEFFPDTIALANRAADYAEASERSPAALAINWVLANETVSSVLIGPKNAAQLESYLATLEVHYTAEDEAFLSALCPSGHLPVLGLSDPDYPYLGRYLPERLRSS